MYILENVLLSLGGITLFLLGLKFMSENMEGLTGKKVKNLMSSVTSNRFSGVLAGAGVTAILQSSVAVNIILVGFVSNGALSFYQASSIIMGSNIGTTMTAHLVSLSSNNFFNVTALGSLILFIGFIFSFSKKNTLMLIGNVMVGFGMLFLGLEIINKSIIYFKNIEAFRSIFLVDNDLLLLLNGIFITAIVQSSSAVTSVMIILASNGLISFESSMFLVLGANIGTCFAVIVASLSKSKEAQKTAFFNLFFNCFGAIILFIPLIIFKSQIADAFTLFSGGIERQIANFHTLFNLFVTLILLPILKPFTKFIDYLFEDKSKKGCKKLSSKTSKNVYVAKI